MIYFNSMHSWVYIFYTWIVLFLILVYMWQINKLSVRNEQFNL